MSEQSTSELDRLDPDEPFRVRPPECRFPECEETGQTPFDPFCCQDHRMACLRASMGFIKDPPRNGGAPEKWEEECRKELEAIESEPKRSPSEMQLVIDRIKDQ